MTKKLIFVGPPGAGKTTLRKIFFEGENASNLLNFSLEPTYGQESLVLEFKDDIGIFDLAGQENQRWFETEEKSVFCNNEVILVVFDVTTNRDDILDFFRKIKNIRDELAPLATIYVIIHKIDLIIQKKLSELKYFLSSYLKNEKLVRILFTSIKKNYYIQTFSSFINILKTCLKDQIFYDKTNLVLLSEAIELLDRIKNEMVISFKDLQLDLNISIQELDKIVNYLVEREQIQVKVINGNERILSLSEKGKKILNDFYERFSLRQAIKFEEDDLISDMLEVVKVVPFLGFLIANKNGLSLLSVELSEGLLESLFDSGMREKKINLDLLSMYISAMEKFAKEINIQDLSGFTLMGSNLKMHVFGFGELSVIFFTNPNILMKSIEYKIRNYFINFFEDHKDIFKKCIKNGSLSELLELRGIGREWLEDLNKTYEHMTLNFEIYDVNHAKTLYNELEELHDEINAEFLIILEKIKELKIRLTKAILDDNINDVKSVAEKAKDLKLKIKS